MVKNFRSITFALVVLFSSTGQLPSGETAATDDLERSYSEIAAVHAKKNAIQGKVRERVAAVIPRPNRFEIDLVAKNVTPGIDPYKWGYTEFNFVVSYKTEPYDEMDVYETVRAVIESAMEILTEEGFEPIKNKIKIRCRTSMMEQQRGETVYYSFGKGHWSYEDYHDNPIQFRTRWSYFTDGE